MSIVGSYSRWFPPAQISPPTSTTAASPVASHVARTVVVQGHAKDVSLEDVKGTVRLEGDFMESVKLSRIAKAVTFKTTRTDMDFTRLDGDLSLDSGDLEASNIIGPINLRTRSKDSRMNGVTSNVQLKNENGAVELEVSKLGNLQIENRRGDIRIFLPEKSSFQVDAQTREILGAAILGTGGDEAIHSILDVMYAKAPYTVMQRAMHIHPTVAEHIPTMLGEPYV